MAKGNPPPEVQRLVERMLNPSAGSELALRNSKGQGLHNDLPKAKTPHEQASLRGTIAAIDRAERRFGVFVTIDRRSSQTH
jgi:hypothetical protein